MDDRQIDVVDVSDLPKNLAHMWHVANGFNTNVVLIGQKNPAIGKTIDQDPACITATHDYAIQVMHSRNSTDKSPEAKKSRFDAKMNASIALADATAGAMCEFLTEGEVMVLLPAEAADPLYEESYELFGAHNLAALCRKASRIPG